MPPARPRIALAVDGRVVGSVEAEDARLLSREVPGLVADAACLSIGKGPGDDASASLGAIGLALRQAGRLGPWRDEELPVLADDGSMLGRIERATMRVLGLRTIAVHLVGWTADGRMWVQRRALDKAVDPGLLDTLAGGLVGLCGDSAGRRMEALAEAMGREADEEAGFDAGATTLRRLAGPPLRVSRPVDDGYMVEDLVGFEACIDAVFVPRNRDGEVAGFECLATDALVERIGRDEFTLEASILVLGWLRRAGRAGS